MKNISILFLILLILFGCNNVYETLSKIKNKNLNNKNLDTENEQEIEKYKYQDICELFFVDGEAIFLIHTKGTKAAENSLISLLNEEFNNRYISERNRRICIMRDNEVDTYVQKNIIIPPPPPPEVIEIVEYEVEIEDDVVIDDTESDEDEMIEIEDESDDEFFMVVENMPEFPGGDLGLMKYIQKNVKYPPIAKQYNITGKVYVSFIVEKSGYVSNVKVVRGVDKNLDAEAVRVVNSLPKYKPGKQRGKPARVMFTIPINFTLS